MSVKVMKKIIITILLFSIFLLSACSRFSTEYDIVATTLPVYSYTAALCGNTNLSVGRLITDNISCLHDYSLQVRQMRMIEDADIIVISGVGLEDFMEDILHNAQNVVDASENAHVHSGGHTHAHSREDHTHHQDHDPHIWLSPENAKFMAQNICQALCIQYPDYCEVFKNNLQALLVQLDELQEYATNQLEDLSCRELITFHDGFAYLAESFDLTILEAIEEESGSEASAKEIINLANLIESHHIPAIFTETNSSDACASILQSETGVNVFTLDMAMTGDSYFDSMYHNINTLKEALQ